MLDVEANTNVHRLEYLYLNLVGQVIQVHTIDGAISEGIFVSRTDPETPENEAGIFVSCSRFLRSRTHEPLDAMQFSLDTKLFRYHDILLVESPRVKLRTEIPGIGHVHSYRGEHSLKAVNWAEEGKAELLENDQGAGDWDQFKANERLGVVSTYSEDKYTTKLDHNKITKEQHEYATRMAKEIESSPARGVQHRAERGELVGDDIDEGQLFSDVARDKSKKGYMAPIAANGGAAAGRKSSETKPMSATQGSANAAAVPSRRPGAGPNADTIATAQVQGAGFVTTTPAAGYNNSSPTNLGRSGDFNPNPAAAPFVPARAIINDYLKTIADAIFNNPECYETTSEWPGEEHHYDKDDSSYSQQPKQAVYMPSQSHQHSLAPSAPQPPQGPSQAPHMNPQTAYGVNGNPIIAPNQYSRSMGHQVMSHHHHHHMHHSPPFPGAHGMAGGGNELAHYQMATDSTPTPGAHHITHHQQYMDPPTVGTMMTAPSSMSGNVNGTMMATPVMHGGSGMNSGGVVSGSHGGGTPLPGPSPARVNPGRVSKAAQPQQPVSVSTGIPSMVSSPPPQLAQSTAALRPQTASPLQQQQPSSSAPPQQQQQQQGAMRAPTPQAMPAVAAVDSAAERSASSAQPAKKLRRGGISTVARNETTETTQSTKKGSK